MRPFGKFVALLVLIAPETPAFPCSTFAAGQSAGGLMGRNVDTPKGGPPGLLIVNKRGVDKKAIPWGSLGPARESLDTPAWRSRFGSVTFTAMGRDMPDGGMNEMGLVVEEMTLTSSSYPRKPGRAYIGHMQWIQFQLDNYATVAEVVRNLGQHNIKGWNWHFMVGDRSGECAAIEFIDGSPKVSRGSSETGCVLTNDRHDVSLVHRSDYVGFGGSKPLPTDPSSLSRFVRASASLQSMKVGSPDDRLLAGFRLLDAVAAPDGGTIRSIVHDPHRMRVHFRTIKNRSIRFVDLTKLDFSTKSPVMIFDIDAPGVGNITENLSPFVEAENRRIVEGMIAFLRRNPASREKMDAELAAAGVGLDEWIGRLATNPSVQTHTH